MLTHALVTSRRKDPSALAPIMRVCLHESRLLSQNWYMHPKVDARYMGYVDDCFRDDTERATLNEPQQWAIGALAATKTSTASTLCQPNWGEKTWPFPIRKLLPRAHVHAPPYSLTRWNKSQPILTLLEYRTAVHVPQIDPNSKCFAPAIGSLNLRRCWAYHASLVLLSVSEYRVTRLIREECF